MTISGAYLFAYLVFGLVLCCLLYLLWYIRSILEPLIIAAFIAYLINPAINFLVARRRMSRKVSVNLVLFHHPGAAHRHPGHADIAPF